MQYIVSITEQDKQKLLKAFTNLLKGANGKGPKNIYVKVVDNVIQFVIHGVVSDFEKYLIKNFGEEAIATFTDFYERDSVNFEKALIEALSDEPNLRERLKFLRLESDFHKDTFIYHMRVECNQLHT